MGVREVNRLLEQWKMNARNLPLWMILALTPRERERWHALWLLDQGWTASATADAWERDPHTIGRWAAALDEGGPTALMFEQNGVPPSAHRRLPLAPPKALVDPPANLPATRIRARSIALVTPSPHFHCPHAVHRCPSVDSG